MKGFIITSILIVFSYTNNSAQELNGTQIWELIKDYNSNGWVDPGDEIKCQIEITANSKVPLTAGFENLMEDQNFILAPGTVTATSGNIASGNSLDDKIISINNIELEAPWGYATLTFQAFVKDPMPEDISMLNNQSTITSTIGSVKTNQLYIPLKSTSVLPSDSSYLQSNLILLVILIVGVTSGLLYARLSRQRTPKLSYK